MQVLSKPFFLLLLFILIIGVAHPATGEQLNRTVTAQQWQTLTNDTVFNYKNRKEFVKDLVTKKEKPNAISEILGKILDFFATTVGQFLFWGFILLILAYAGYKMLSDNSFLFKKDKKPIQHSTEEIDEDITLANWEERMQQAIKNNDLRHAVRYSYMWLLQLLQYRELIQYRNDKTNYDYYNELIDTPYKQSFKQLSRQYEYAWYGHFNIADSAYDEYMSLFNTVKKQLS